MPSPDPPRIGRAEVSYGNQLFADEMEPDDLRAGFFLEVAHHRVPNHFIQFLDGVGDSENRLTQRLGGIAPLRGVHAR
jgi:hypothetical protein